MTTVYSDCHKKQMIELSTVFCLYFVIWCGCTYLIKVHHFTYFLCMWSFTFVSCSFNDTFHLYVLYSHTVLAVVFIPSRLPLTHFLIFFVYFFKTSLAWKLRALHHSSPHNCTSKTSWKWLVNIFFLISVPISAE
jgi:hypothetical protein